MTMGVSVHVSTLTSMAIAVDRYFVIVHPFRPRMKSGVCFMLIGAIWLISVSISLPLAIYQKVSRWRMISCGLGDSDFYKVLICYGSVKSNFIKTKTATARFLMFSTFGKKSSCWGSGPGANFGANLGLVAV